MSITGTLIVQMIVFLILVWFTMKFVWPPLIKALDERSQKIADGLAAAEKGKAELDAANKRVDQELSQARNEGQQRIADAEKRAQVVADEIKRNAQAEAARIVAWYEIVRQTVLRHDLDHPQLACLTVLVNGSLFADDDGDIRTGRLVIGIGRDRDLRAREHHCEEPTLYLPVSSHAKYVL